MEAKVSVIVPVYNTEKYLPQCLDSLLAQTCGNMETICVDDGSTDNSPGILRRYARADRRVKILTQENMGQGAARNRGLETASGKYLAFVDSDDWLAPGALERLCRFAEKNSSRVVQFNHTERDEASGEERAYSFADKAMLECGFDLRAEGGYSWRDIGEGCLCKLDPHACFYFYSAEFVRRNGVRFAELRRAEDHPFSLGAALSAERIDYLDEALYFYRRREGSTTTTRADDNFLVFDSVEQFRKFIAGKGLWDELAEEFHRYEKQIMVWHYEQTPLSRIKEYEALCKERLCADEWKDMNKAFKDRRRLWRKAFVKGKIKKMIPAFLWKKLKGKK